MKMKFLVLATLIAGVVAGPTFDHENRVGLGHETDISEFNFQVSLQQVSNKVQNLEPTKDSPHFCGGSIINKKWIVTAAHCVWKKTNKTFEVVAGISTLKEIGQRIKVAKIIIHKDYKGDKNGGVGPNDIALIKLLEELEYNDKVGEIKLPKQDESFTGSANVTGWGVTTLISLGASTKLRRAEVRITSYLECLARLGFKVKKEENICTSALFHRSCSGDSGGPLSKVTDDGVTLIGVVSWGIVGCVRGPSAYANVAHYVKFIQDAIDADQTL